MLYRRNPNVMIAVCSNDLWRMHACVWRGASPMASKSMRYMTPTPRRNNVQWIGAK
jgi:hypothetical protein